MACPLAGLSANLFPICLLLNYKLSENIEGNDCNSSIMFTKGKCENQLRMRGYMKNIMCISSNIYVHTKTIRFTFKDVVQITYTVWRTGVS